LRGARAEGLAHSGAENKKGTSCLAFASALPSDFFSCLRSDCPPAASWQSFTVIHDFTGEKDGAVPGYTLLPDGKGGFIGTANQGGAGGGVLFDSAGHLFGTAVLGGANDMGVVYEVTP
jgi:hypothetical protein